MINHRLKTITLLAMLLAAVLTLVQCTDRKRTWQDRINRYSRLAEEQPYDTTHADTQRTAAAVHPITKTEWDSATASSDYYYKNLREHLPKQEEKKRDSSLDNASNKFWDALIDFYKNGLTTVLLWLIVIGILLYVAYRYALNNNLFFISDPPQTGKLFNMGDADFYNTNWEELMNIMLQQGEWNKAINFAFIKLLHNLHTQKVIEFAYEKTNFDYYLQIENKNYKQAFRTMSIIFERSIYGNSVETRETANAYIYKLQHFFDQTPQTTPEANV